jgi:hypothetical protein
LRYCRSRFFTFVFFMQKLTGISSGQNNKSCRIIHHESNKIGFTFFRFFCDFLRNLQESGNHFYYWSSPFAVRTLERMLALQCSPWARLASAGEQNLASSPVLAAREGRGKGLGTTGARFGHLDRAVAAPVSRHAGGGRCQPRQLAVRRGAAREGTVGGGA